MSIDRTTLRLGDSVGEPQVVHVHTGPIPDACAKLLRILYEQAMSSNLPKWMTSSSISTLPSEDWVEPALRALISRSWVNEYSGSLTITDAGIRALDDHLACQALRALESMTDRERDCVLALGELNATCRDKRVQARRVATKVHGGMADENSVKEPLAKLVGLGLAASARGRKGGAWLTEDGQLEFERLRK